MKLLKKLHNRVEAPGLEWQILRRLPRYLLAATIAPLLVAMGARIVVSTGSSAEAAKQIMSIDIFCIAVAVTAWTTIFTIGIGSLVVHVMKGPGYVADSYDVSHSDRPRQPDDE